MKYENNIFNIESRLNDTLDSSLLLNQSAQSTNSANNNNPHTEITNSDLKLTINILTKQINDLNTQIIQTRDKERTLREWFADEREALLYTRKKVESENEKLIIESEELKTENDILNQKVEELITMNEMLEKRLNITTKSIPNNSKDGNNKISNLILNSMVIHPNLLAIFLITLLNVLFTIYYL